jgi:hypothetical protein
MVQACRTLAFRWLLPVTQLVLCIVALWPLRAVIIQEVRDSIHAYRPLKTPPPYPLENQQFPTLVFDLPNPRELRAFEALERRKWIPMLLNLPSGLAQLPYAILNPAKQEWMPRGMNFRTWSVISWPLVGIIFWWSAGRGIEALIAARRRLVHPRISWTETVAGAALCLFCAVASVCLPLYGGVDEEFPVKLWIAGSGIWTVLGGAMVAARVAQWRIRRRAQLTKAPEVSPA